MWRKAKRPAPEELVVPDDIDEARELREANRADLAELQSKVPIINLLADRIIDRQGKNHYIELLYWHAPRGAA